MVGSPLAIKLRRQADDNTHFWLRLFVVATVLILSAWLAPRASVTTLGLLLGAGCLLIVLHRPPVGVLALVIASQLVAFTIATGTQSPLNATVLLLGVLLALWLVTKLGTHDLRFVRSRPIIPLLSLCGVAILAFVGGYAPWLGSLHASSWLAFAQTAPLAAQIGGLSIFLLSAGAFLLVANQIHDVRWLERLTWLFIAVAALPLSGYFVPSLGHLYALFHPTNNPDAQGGLFWTWLVALAFSQAVFNKNLRLPWRLMLGGIVIAAFYVGMGVNHVWLSGWMPPLLAVLVILWSAAPRPALALTALGSLVVALNFSQISNFVAAGGENVLYLSIRQDFWTHLLEVMKANPVIGTGFANYSWYMVLFPTVDAAFGYLRISSHNNYADLVLQTGLLGLGCFLWFAWEVGRLAWKLRTQVPAGFSQAYVHGALGGLAGTLFAAGLGDWVLPYTYNIGLGGFRASVLGWLFLGGVVALEQISNRGRAAGKVPTEVLAKA